MGGRAITLILQQKPALTLLSIKREGGTYASVISREIESTFAHTANILNRLREQGLVAFESDGSDSRVKRIVLTPKGEDAAVLVEELAAVLEGREVTDSSKKKAAAEEFISRINMIRLKIELISKEELDGKKSISQKDYVRIGQRLGPYRRELRKIIEKGKKKDVSKAQDLDAMIDNIFKMRERLRSS